jgi:hypothetical protein
MGLKHLWSFAFVAFAIVACEQKAPASPAQSGAPSAHRTDGGSFNLYEASKQKNISAHRRAPANAKKAIKKGKTTRMEGRVGTVKIGRPGSPTTKKIFVSSPRAKCAAKKPNNPSKAPAKTPTVKVPTGKTATAKPSAN